MPLAVWLLLMSWAPGTQGCEETTVRLAAFQIPRDEHVFCVVSRPGDAEAGSTVKKLQAWVEEYSGNLNIAVEHLTTDRPVAWRDYGMPSAPPALPVTVLVGRQSIGMHAFVVDHWEPAPTATELAAIAESPVREQVRKSVVAHEALVLFSPGANGDGTGREAISAFLDGKKEDDARSFTLIEFDRSQPEERLLTRFAGLRPEDPDWAALVFGRAKLMAPPLVGAELTKENLNALADRLNAPCTCLESPASLGIDLPLVWDPELDTIAVPKAPLQYSETGYEQTAAIQELAEPPLLPPALEEQAAASNEADSRVVVAAAIAVGLAGLLAGGTTVLVIWRARSH